MVSARARRRTWVAYALTAASLCGALAAPADAADAVAYRQDAAHSGFSATGPAPPLTPRWTRDLGDFVSYPLVVDGRIFVVLHDPGLSGYMLHALDAATGDTLWSRSVTGHEARALPAYENGTVYVQDGAGLMRAFDAQTGERRWAAGVGGGPNAASPVATGGTVYTKSSARQGIAVDGSTGDVRWTYGTYGSASGGSPAVGGGLAFFSDNCPASAAVNLATGAEAWKLDNRCSGGSLAGPPVLGAERVFLRDVRFGRVASAATGTLLPGPAFDQPPAIAGDVGVFMDGPVVTARSIVGDEELWSFTADGTAWPAPLIVGGHVYVGSDTGALNALDLATGESVWDTTIVGGVAHSAEAWLMPAMAAGDGLIVVPGADGSLVAFAHEAAPPAALPAPSLAPLDLAMPSPPAGAAIGYRGDAARSGFVAGPDGDAPLQELWSRATTGPASYPVISGGRVVVTETVGTDAVLSALDRRTGKPLWSKPLAGWWSGPLAYAGLIVVGNSVGEVRAFDAVTGAPRWTTVLDDDDYDNDFSSTPIGADGKILVTGEGYLWALDAATGAQRWKQLVDGTGSPAAAGGSVFVSDTCHATLAFAIADGARRWGGIGCGGAAEKTTAVHQGRVWSRDEGSSTSGGVRDAATGRVLDAYAVDEPPAFAGDLAVVLSSSALQAYDVDTGVMRWEHRGPLLTAAPLIMGPNVYSATADGVMHAFDLRTGELLWTDAMGSAVPESADHDDRLHTGLGAGEDTLVVPTQDRLVAYVPTRPTITSGPQGGGTADFAFALAGHVLECRLDAQAWAACVSPLHLSGLAPGAHRFEVRGVDPEGRRTAPAEWRWTVAAEPPATGAPAGAAGPLGSPPVFPQTRAAVRSLRAEARDPVARLRRVLERRGLAAITPRGGLLVGYRATRRYSITLEIRGRGRSRPLLARGTARAFRPGMLRIRLRAQPALRRRGHLRAVRVTARVRTRAGARAVATHAVRVARRRGPSRSGF